MDFSQKAKDFLWFFTAKARKFDLFGYDFRKIQKKLDIFPEFSPDLLTPIGKELTQSDLTGQIIKIWLPPMISLIKEVVSTPNILEFDSFFKNALVFLEIERKSLDLMELFRSDPEFSGFFSSSLFRIYSFLQNLLTFKSLLLSQNSQNDKISLYSARISEIYSFSYELFRIFEGFFSVLSKTDAKILANIQTFLQKHMFDETMNIPIRTSSTNIPEKESIEEIDVKFKEFQTKTATTCTMSLPLSYLNCLEQKNELLDYNLDFLNTPTTKTRKSEVELTAPLPGNTSKRQRTLSRISQKIREKSIHSTFQQQISSDEIGKNCDGVVWLTETEIKKQEKLQKELNNTDKPPSFINKFAKKKLIVSENEQNLLKNLNENNILSCVNYEEVVYDMTVDLKKLPLVPRKEEKKPTFLKFQEKILKNQEEMESTANNSMTSHDMDSSTHKDPSNPSNRGSLLLSSIRRNSKKLPSKIIKDSYEQMKELEKKNQTILKTFKKSKEKSKIRHKKKEVISIIKINGVSFQEPEDIINKNQAAELTPEFVKDIDEEDVLSNSSTSSDEDEKEWNSVLERKRFLNSLYQGSKPRLTLKRHSKILTGREGRLDNEKFRKITEKKNLFQNWHLIEDVELLRNVSGFNVKTSRESVNFFIIKFLINMKLKSHEYTSQLKIIRERWNKIKFAFQMYLLYIKLHKNRTISFFDEAHIIVNEMRQISFLHEFDKFLYLMERNQINEEKNSNEIVNTFSDFSRKRARSQSKNIHKMMDSINFHNNDSENNDNDNNEINNNNVIILERSMKKFTPKKHWNSCMKFLVFDAETIETKLYEKPKPDIILL